MDIIFQYEVESFSLYLCLIHLYIYNDRVKVCVYILGRTSALSTRPCNVIKDTHQHKNSFDARVDGAAVTQNP